MEPAGATDLSWEAFQAARTRAFSRMKATTAMVTFARAIVRASGTGATGTGTSEWSDVDKRLPARGAQDGISPYLDYAGQLVTPDEATGVSGDVGQLSVGCDDPATLVAAITWGPPHHRISVDLAHGQASVSQIAPVPSARLRAWAPYADYSNEE